MAASDWPDGYRSAAALTFDLDAASAWRQKMARDEAWRKPTIETRGEFGPRVAVPRILELLERYDLESTFFVPGEVVENWPETVRGIRDAGHEIGYHGYTHTNPADATREEEVAELERAFAVYDDVLGVTPVGYRSPAADLSEHTLAILAENGIRYESSFVDDDLPYFHDVESGPVVELPFEWSLDDWPYFGYQMYPPLPYQAGISATGAVFDTWRREFEGLHRRGRCFVLTMHPQLIGRAGRIDALEDLVQAMLDTGEAWVTSGERVAAHWQRTHDP